MISLTVSLLLAAAPDTVLVTSYQTLGVDEQTVAQVVEGFRAACNATQLQALSASESDKMNRSAVMCGEDGACLATVGQRSNARWVLAFGVGKVGSSLLLSAVFVDVKQGREVMNGSRRVPEGAPDWAAATKSLADEVVKLPVEAKIIEVERPQSEHKLRPWAFTTVGLAGAFAIISTVVGVAAMGNYGKLKMAGPSEFAQLEKDQRTLNGSADICLIGAALFGATSLVLFILDWWEKPSAATFDSNAVAPPVVTWW